MADVAIHVKCGCMAQHDWLRSLEEAKAHVEQTGHTVHVSLRITPDPEAVSMQAEAERRQREASARERGEREKRDEVRKPRTPAKRTPHRGA